MYFGVYWDGGSAELDGLHAAKHSSHYPTAEHVLVLFSCPEKPFLLSPYTQISTIKAQKATLPRYSPWLLLQKSLLTSIASHPNGSLIHFLINSFIAQRRLYSLPDIVPKHSVGETHTSLIEPSYGIHYILSFVPRIHFHFSFILIHAECFEDKNFIFVIVIVYTAMPGRALHTYVQQIIKYYKERNTLIDKMRIVGSFYNLHNQNFFF